MKFFPTRIIMVFCCLFLLVLHNACQKDSDLLADYVVNDRAISSVRKFVVDDRFQAPTTGSIGLDVLTNDNFQNSLNVSISETSNPVNGSIEINADNTLTYSVNNPQATTDSFTYTAELNNTDGSVTTETGNVDIVITDQTIELNVLKAFPSAQGHGADEITGGAGGKIFYVDDLSNNTDGSYDPVSGTHSGSFKYALQHPDPGYVIFRVSGIIHANSVSDYLINSPDTGNKTIMGGTAPYPGIFFYGHQFRIGPGEGNWIFRGMTFLGGNELEPGKYDAFLGQDISKVILSDNTFGWSSDEAASFDDADKIIVQRNLMFEGHPDHNTGSLMAVDTYASGVRKLSIHNNGYIHISHRFPNVRALDSDYVDVINQFAYNWRSRISSHKFQLNLNDINNYYKRGSRTSSAPKLKWNADDEGSPLWDDTPHIYSKGNIITGIFENLSLDNSALWNHHITSKGYISGEVLPQSFFTNNMHPVGLDIKIKPAKDAYDYNIVGKNIGSRYYMASNGVAKKYISPFVNNYFNDAINGTSVAFLDNHAKFTLPSLPAASPPYVDSDYDGMADAWEKEHGLKVGEADQEGVTEIWVIDGVTYINNAGYSNMQMFNDYVHGGFKILKDQL